MTAYEPPAEAVEAVAKIIDPSAWGDNWWGFRAPDDTRTAEELREADRERARSDARAVLTAAGPIAASPIIAAAERREVMRELDDARRQVADLRAGIEAAVVTLNREAYRRPTPWIDRLANDLRALLARGEGA